MDATQRVAIECVTLAGNATSLDAGGAHPDPLVSTVNAGAHTLNVGVPTTLSLLLRPGYVVAEPRALGADVTYGSHSVLLGSGVPLPLTQRSNTS